MMCSTAPFKERQKAVNIASLPDNCLAVVNPGLAAQWHPTKNGELTPEIITAGSGRKIWWLCKEGHEWQAAVVGRNSGSGCPYCSGNKVLKGYNDLAIVNPALAAEWHPTKNGDLMPDMVTAGSSKKSGGSVRMGMNGKRKWQAETRASVVHIVRGAKQSRESTTLQQRIRNLPQNGTRQKMKG